MRIAYSIILYLLSPLFIVHLLVRSIRAPAYRQRWRERFGFYSDRPVRKPIWVHAVSVGEAQAAMPLIRRLQAQYPTHTVLVTTTTPTGSQRVREVFGDDVMHVYVPYDLPGAVGRFMEAMQPCAAIIMETEIWPNLYAACAARDVPLILANARLSERSMRGYRRLGRFTREVVNNVSVIAAQGQSDAARFIALGAAPDKVTITGNIKFDIQTPASLAEQAAVLRRDLGVERRVWIAASTHQGEDELVLDAHAQVMHALPDALLVIVPRHPERFDRVSSLCEKRGYNVVRRSAHRACADDVDIYIGDSMGELDLFYAASDVAFIGGSLVDVGGHNPLEAAAMGRALVQGNHTFNFVEITRMLREAGAVREVHDSEELATVVCDLLRDANWRSEAGERAKAVVERNRGALVKLLDCIEKHIDDL
jgi:3-deoxy-D-manno-octulosonic-acid transferase